MANKRMRRILAGDLSGKDSAKLASVKHQCAELTCSISSDEQLEEQSDSNSVSPAILPALRILQIRKHCSSPLDDTIEEKKFGKKLVVSICMGINVLLADNIHDRMVEKRPLL